MPDTAKPLTEVVKGDAMAKDLQPKDDYNDGLAAPPELPPPATSQAGTVAQAEALQQQNNVPAKFRGPWYHETYDDIASLDNQHEEWTWLTRSPGGGTIWGETVLVVYVVAVPENSKVHAASNKGDKLGFEGEDALPEWWLSVGREDIPKLIVVSKFHQKNDEDQLKGLLETDGYKATRQEAIEKLQALKKPKPAGG
jgi:hypothetical protein